MRQAIGKSLQLRLPHSNGQFSVNSEATNREFTYSYTSQASSSIVHVQKEQGSRGHIAPNVDGPSLSNASVFVCVRRAKLRANGCRTDGSILVVTPR